MQQVTEYLHDNEVSVIAAVMEDNAKSRERCSEENNTNESTSSCCQLAQELSSEYMNISDRQQKDPELKLIMDYLEKGHLPKDDKKARQLVLGRPLYQVIEGILYHMEPGKSLCPFPPDGDREHLFHELHGGIFGAHLKDVKIHGELSKHYWWPKMRADICKWCCSCLVCVTCQAGRVVQPPLTPIPVYSQVGVDVIQFPKSHTGNRYEVVFVDYLTKWPKVFATSDQTALTIAKLFVEQIVCCHGVPVQLLSDRGAAFLSRLLMEICELLGVEKLNTTAYHPQTDGLAKRFSRTLTDMLAKKVEQGGRDWDAHLPFVHFTYRASLPESTKESPFYLLYGRDPRLPTTLGLDSMQLQQEQDLTNLDTYKEEVALKFSEAWKFSGDNIKIAQKYQKKQYNCKQDHQSLRWDIEFSVIYLLQRHVKLISLQDHFMGPIG